VNVTVSFGAALLQGNTLPGPILTIDDAFAANSLHEEPGVLDLCIVVQAAPQAAKVSVHKGQQQQRVVDVVAMGHHYQAEAASRSTFCNAAAPTADEAAKGAEKRAAVDAALAAAPRSIRGARYAIGSQQHFYMEPQASGTAAALLRTVQSSSIAWALDSACHVSPACARHNARRCSLPANQ
jgi:xanthine dehydrogenase molybdopterin-binding subunit B